MSYSLCIVESPAKCGKIQGFLGTGWKVLASMGHIRSLEEDLGAVGIDRDFEPRYTFMKEKGKTLSALKEAAKDAHTVYLAADDDREGEAIAFSVALLLGLNPATTHRAVFHEITKTAVTAAIQSPRRLDMNRVNAQQARAILDMLVGFTISPLLWKHVGPGLSAGRCQTPALRLLVDREKDILNFKAETSWQISGTWTSPSKKFTFNAKLFDSLEDEESALNYLENIHAEKGAHVVNTKTQPRSESAPKPFITSSLQQEASVLFSSQPKQTMKAAQRLYEQGHITYMRTDSAILSEQAKTEGAAWIAKEFGAEYLGSSKKTVVNSTNAQEAHEAIRPTHMNMTTLPPTEEWSPHEQKLYKLIWQRTIQSLMAASRHEEHTVLFVADGDPAEFIWQNTWKRSLFAGWKRVGLGRVNIDEHTEEKDETTEESLWKVATSFKQGDTLEWKSLAAEPQESRPTGRYTEATLVRELESRGIGRPSTFASLVGTLLEKDYTRKEDKPAQEVEVASYHVEKSGQWPPIRQLSKKKVGAEKQKMTPTALGLSVHEFCMREFPVLFAYDFTKSMEERLDKIASGGEPWKQVCRDTWDSYKDKYATLKTGAGSKGTKERGFDDGVKAVQTKKGPLLLIEGPGEKEVKFLGWPAGVAFHEITQEQVSTFCESALAGPQILGEHKGTPIEKKKGPYGWYAQCGATKIPLQAGDTLGKIQDRLLEKEQSVLHKIGAFEFRKGPYGVYMFKKETGGKKPSFVSIPDGLDPKALTEEAAARIYTTGIEQKKKSAASGFRGGGRGGGRGGRGGRT
jgi:DNA topoisomerase-1